MPFAHEAVAAIGGVTGASAVNKALLRAMCTRRIAYTLASDESGSDFTAVDPADGTIPLYLIKDGTLYQYDSADSTTAPGATCIVTSDNKRYKSGGIDYPWSVLDKDTIAQPATPAVGDRYLIPTAATGTDWAGQDGKVGIYIAAGWRFAPVPIGRPLYVEDETAFYHRNAAGTWTAGFGSIALGVNSVTLPMVVGANASFVIKVENQTTNAQPASPVTPTAYIIGPSPTGAQWAGNAGKLAICLVDGAWTIITPAAGDVVYDKTLKASYEFDGTTWTSQAGAWRFQETKYQSGNTDIVLDNGSSKYTYSTSTPPTTSNRRRYESGSMPFTRTAKRVGAWLRFTYQASVTPSSSGLFACGLWVDSETNARRWEARNLTGANFSETVEFSVQATDLLPHTYTVAWLPPSSPELNDVVNRTWRIEESF